MLGSDCALVPVTAVKEVCVEIYLFVSWVTDGAF